jgi:hypothetical protein
MTKERPKTKRKTFLFKKQTKKGLARHKTGCRAQSKKISP